MQNLREGDFVKLNVDDFQFINKTGIILKSSTSRSTRCLVLVDYQKVEVPEHMLELISEGT